MAARSLREAQVDGEEVLVRDKVGNRSLIVFGAGDEISVQAGEEGVRFLLVSGRPLREPIAWHGPIVMNTQDQIRQALTDLIARQPDLRKKLSELLVEPSYPVARLDCDRGDQTYVLLNDRQLVAIYRDGDIGAIDRLARR